MQKENQTIDNPQRVSTSTQTHPPINIDQYTDEELATEIQRLVADLSTKRQKRVLTSAKAIVSFS